MNKTDLKPGDKFLLTVNEASKYFNIGEGKLRSILADHRDSRLYILSGNRALINRKAFEKFLEAATEV